MKQLTLFLLIVAVISSAQSVNITGTVTLTDVSVSTKMPIVLGIGFPTIVPTAGNIALKIDDVDGVRVAGLLLEGTTTNSPCLMQVGDSGSTVGHSKNPTVLGDIFTRVGGEYNGLATCFVKINSNEAG